MKKSLWILAVLTGLGAGAAFYYDRTHGVKPGDTPRQEAPPPESSLPQDSAKPAILHPLDVAADPELALPALEESDDVLREALAELLGKKPLANFFHPERLIRRVVATIDNLPRKTVALRVMPVKPVAGAFVVTGAENDLVIGAKNDARYAPYVAVMQAVDVPSLSRFYVRFYPLFQQAYEELGYPKGYFNDRLVEALDNMLDAPDLREPVKLLQPKVVYVFADPSLEERSAGQKILMRMGSGNAAKVKDKLRDIRREILQRTPNQ